MILEITSLPYNTKDKFGDKSYDYNTKTAYINTEMIQSVITYYSKVQLDVELYTTYIGSKITMSDGMVFYSDKLPREISEIINNQKVNSNV